MNFIKLAAFYDKNKKNSLTAFIINLPLVYCIVFAFFTGFRGFGVFDKIAIALAADFVCTFLSALSKLLFTKDAKKVSAISIVTPVLVYFLLCMLLKSCILHNKLFFSDEYITGILATLYMICITFCLIVLKVFHSDKR